jgi:hypothetical protein
MSDRTLLFLGSVLMIVICLGACGLLAATGQALTLDGLFLISVCGLGALVCALYLWFLIGRAKEELEEESKPAK